ncbi:uncharacterized protein PHACADRAFT_86834 [Phanerochaete carnosa HHB-10118-sp]|uniref:CN hydrolase domain-containing protein n=1 Tax=Phanerochaete carnosa (strain HHB-10118-sp) TaxID=650164 RepID=K5WJV1_PHACS|nr:uncharacterized protein PHACADRAFT_86834 [Phanerochaete carnosa HHB-10118-sp]EKM59399.1 hypothetical protein PHACADRAFT_86834 [Phanerochaete carnosa HHB-10118-sp]
MSGKNVIRASVIQACSAQYSLSATLDKLERLVRQVAQEGSQLAVFPMAFVGGYPRFSTFGTRVGFWPTPEGRDEFVRYYDAAIEVPGSDAVARMEAVSRETGIFLVVGVVERHLGTLYCTAVFVDPVQGYVTKHRKLMPTMMERIIWGQGDAAHLPVPQATFATKGEERSAKARLSASLCWENYMPLIRTFYYSQGTQIYCAPTIDDSPGWQHSMHHIALEGRCFVLSASQYAEDKDYPEGHAVADKNDPVDPGVVMSGGSIIISPLGKVLAGPLWKQEGVLTADLDLDDLPRGKFDLDVTGHYARHDGE